MAVGDADQNPPTRYETRSDGQVVVTLPPAVDAAHLNSLWNQIIAPLKSSNAAGVTIDAEAVSHLDGAGAGLLCKIQQFACDRDIPFSLENLDGNLQALMDKVSPESDQTCNPRPSRSPLPEDIGRSVMEIVRELYMLVAFTGEVTAALGWAVTHPWRVRFRDLWLQAEKLGVNAIPVLGMLGWLMGAIIAFQTATPMRMFGADADVFVADIVAASIIRELGPLVTAILLAGRSGSAFAAEIGTMKVTEEVNALTTFGLDPVRFLVVPRVLAAMLATPLLSVFASVMGLIGGYVVFSSLGYPLATYLERVRGVVDYVDLLGGTFKALVFSVIVAAIGCLRGLGTKTGPGAVGDATTRAVVISIVLIIVVDGILGAVYFYLGI